LPFLEKEREIFRVCEDIQGEGKSGEAEGRGHWEGVESQMRIMRNRGGNLLVIV